MWRRVWLLVTVGACYAPTLTTGAPCDPALDNCPVGQVCELRAGEFRCGGPGGPGGDATIEIDAAVDAPGEGGSPIDAAIDAPMIDAAIDAPLVTHVEYVAVVAECVNPSNPSPAQCRADNGGTAQLAIDENDSMTNNPWVGFVRFDLDGVLAGRTVTSVKLRMVATSDSKADAPNTGQVWRVDPFTLAALSVTPVPARVGNSPLAGSQGSVNQLQVINWTLPVTLVTANGSVYLEIETPSSDGTNYWNLAGPNPPRLVIDLL